MIVSENTLLLTSVWPSIRSFFANLAQAINEKRPLRKHNLVTMYDYSFDFKAVPAFNKFHDVTAVQYFLNNQWSLNTAEDSTDGIRAALTHVQEQLREAIESRQNQATTDQQAVILLSHSAMQVFITTQVKQILRWFMDNGVYVISVRK